jgi:DNA-binding SARP family transcriptional activator
LIAVDRKLTVNAPYASAAHVPRVYLRVVGTFTVSVDGVGVAAPAHVKSRSLLAYLAMRAGEPVRRERLTAEFWPDAEPVNARNSLKTALSSIRRAFRCAGVDPDGIVVADRDDVRWSSLVSSDIDELERCSNDLERGRVLATCDGDVLPGDYGVWACDLRERVGARIEDLLSAELAARPSAVTAERLLLRDPYSHAAYVALIDRALSLGNRREAGAVFRRYASALAEIGLAPSSELAERAGDAAPIETMPCIGFVGRTNELSEVRAWLTAPSVARVLIVCGIAGIGKSALAAEALGRDTNPAANVEIVDGVTQRTGRLIACVRPESLDEARSAYPGAQELTLGALTRDELSRAVSRWNSRSLELTAEHLWIESLGHPLLFQQHLGSIPRDVASARFEAQLLAAGDDAVRVAELLALEAELDDDDIAALLEWTLLRAGEASSRLTSFGIIESRGPAKFSFPLFAEIASRRLTNGRRRQAVAEVAARLALHEHPRTKLRLAEHYRTLGRERDAAIASLDAGRAFIASAAWTNALAAFDGGLAELEGAATSAAATLLLRDLHLARSEVLIQLGHFTSSVRSLSSVLDLTNPQNDADAPIRAVAYVKAGQVFARLNNVDSAWMAVRQAGMETRRCAELGTELEAADLASRLLCTTMRYDEAVDTASRAYDRAMEAGAYRAASSLAQRVGDPLRRLLRFDDCDTWARRQLNAAQFAGPEVEAQAHYTIGAVAYAVNQLTRSSRSCREALNLLATIRRRASFSTPPLGLVEWQCRQALAHVALESGDMDQAFAHSAWLVDSPWAFNTSTCQTMTFATVVNVWLASGTEQHRLAAFEFAKRVPVISPESQSPIYFMDVLTRARLAALSESRARAVELLQASYAATVLAEPMVPDQIHISYEKLAATARGIDDLLAARAAEAGRRHRDRVMEAAGARWAAASP